MRKYANIQYRGPDFGAEAKLLCREFLGRAGGMVRDRVKSKLGKYQPGWPPLTPATLRTKSVRIGGRKVNLKRRRISLVADTPLFDSGRMKKSVASYTKGDNAYIVADFPMNLHEQDSEVGTFRLPSSWIGKNTRRPAMGPALEEMIDPIADELEVFIGDRL